MENNGGAEPDFLSLMVVSAMAVGPTVVASYLLYYVAAQIFRGNMPEIIILVLFGLLECFLIYLSIKQWRIYYAIANAFPRSILKMTIASIIFTVALIFRINWK